MEFGSGALQEAGDRVEAPKRQSGVWRQILQIVEHGRLLCFPSAKRHSDCLFVAPSARNGPGVSPRNNFSRSSRNSR